MVEWWLLWAWRIVVLVAGAAGLWMVKAMKGTIDVQKETIQTMERLLKVADVEAMLIKFEGYKKIVEHVKEAELKQLAARFEQEKRAISLAATKSGMEAVAANVVAPLARNLTSLAIDTLPYVPKEDRVKFINALDLRDDFLPGVKDQLLRFAESARDLSFPALSRLDSLMQPLPPVPSVPPPPLPPGYKV